MSAIRRLLGIDGADGRLKRVILGSAPVAKLLVLLVGMALAATLVGMALAGREPRVMAGQPIERGDETTSSRKPGRSPTRVLAAGPEERDPAY